MNIKISKEFITYCIVGLINTAVGYSTAFICLNLFLLSYPIATGMAYVIGIIVSFFLNKKFTFENKDKSGMQFLKFFTTMLPAYVFSYWLGLQVALISSKYFSEFINTISSAINVEQTRLTDNFAIILSMAIYLIVGFSINKFFVFKKNN